MLFFEHEIQVELKRGLLSFKFNSSLVFTRVDLRLGLADCDGKWNTVSIKKEGSVVSVRVNALKKSTSQAGGQPLGRCGTLGKEFVSLSKIPDSCHKPGDHRNFLL